jgi:hypothetical protein
MNIPKEVLMKLDKEELVNIIASLSEANEKLSRFIGPVVKIDSIGGSGSGSLAGMIENELNTISKEIRAIKDTCETEAEFENKLKVYFDSIK